MENNYLKLQVPVTLSVEEINIVLKWLGTGSLHEVFTLYKKVQDQQVAAVQTQQRADADAAAIPPGGGDKMNGADQSAETVN